MYKSETLAISTEEVQITVKKQDISGYSFLD
jgi:hypothetical protein